MKNRRFLEDRGLIDFAKTAAVDAATLKEGIVLFDPYRKGVTIIMTKR